MPPTSTPAPPPTVATAAPVAAAPQPTPQLAPSATPRTVLAAEPTLVLPSPTAVPTAVSPTAAVTAASTPTAAPPTATAPAVVSARNGPIQLIGRSVKDRRIEAHVLGSGPIAVAFIGNIHGAWEPRAKEVVETGLEYFRSHPDEVPGATSLYFVPTVNPDGYEDGRALIASAPGTGSQADAELARYAFNANDVDLNRNFDANWRPTACGGERFRLRFGDVCRAGMAGSKPFSEPETQAYAEFIKNKKIALALTYHEDQSASISAKEGGGGLGEPLATAVARLYNYPYLPSWPKYPVTGQAQDWLDSIGVVGAEIELKYRTPDRNRDIAVMKLGIDWAITHRS